MIFHFLLNRSIKKSQTDIFESPCVCVGLKMSATQLIYPLLGFPFLNPLSFSTQTSDLSPYLSHIYISRLTAKCLVLSVYLWPRQGVIIHQTGFVFREYMYLSCSNVKMNIVNNFTDNSSILLKWNNNLYFGNFGSFNIRVERFVYHRVKKIRIS